MFSRCQKEKSLALDGRSGLDLDNAFSLAVHVQKRFSKLDLFTEKKIWSKLAF